MSESWTSYSLIGITGVRPGREHESRGRGLIVMVDPQNLAVFAFESLADDFGGVTFQAVFDDHSHHVVLERGQSLTQAIGAAEDYMRRWRLGKLKPHERCDCDEIVIETTAEALKRASIRDGSKMEVLSVIGPSGQWRGNYSIVGRTDEFPPVVVQYRKCPTCGAKPGYLCKTTKPKGYSLQAHAHRLVITERERKVRK